MEILLALVNLKPVAMNVQTSNAAIQAQIYSGSVSRGPVRSLISHDPNLILQLLLAFPIIAGGIVLHINAIQWILVTSVTFFYLAACVLRSAAIIQIKREKKMASFQASRIRCLGNGMVTITAGISLLTYLLVFGPLVSALI